MSTIKEICKKCRKAISGVMYSSKQGWLCDKCNDLEIKEELKNEKSLHNKKNSSSK